MGLLSRGGDPIPWVVQADGDGGRGLGIVVGDCETGIWVVRSSHRKIEILVDS